MMDISYSGITKVISGGQTGADMAGLLAAQTFGIQTGGTAPARYMTEDGPNLELKKLGLIAQGSLKSRTKENIINSDGTVIFSMKASSPGTVLTINTCIQQGRPYLLLDMSDYSRLPVNEHSAVDDRLAGQVKDWIILNKIQVLNVAGNRASKSPEVSNITQSVLLTAFYTLDLKRLVVKQ